jgi:hypothetical protein
VLCEVLFEDGGLARVDLAIRLHRADHRLDHEAPRIVGFQATAQQLLDTPLHQ